MSMFQRGDHVRVKPREEIILLLGRSGASLWFDPKMYNYCGRDFVLEMEMSRNVQSGNTQNWKCQEMCSRETPKI